MERDPLRRLEHSAKAIDIQGRERLTEVILIGGETRDLLLQDVLDKDLEDELDNTIHFESSYFGDAGVVLLRGAANRFLLFYENGDDTCSLAYDGTFLVRHTGSKLLVSEAEEKQKPLFESLIEELESYGDNRSDGQSRMLDEFHSEYAKLQNICRQSIVESLSQTEKDFLLGIIDVGKLDLNREPITSGQSLDIEMLIKDPRDSSFDLMDRYLFL